MKRLLFLSMLILSMLMIGCAAEEEEETATTSASNGTSCTYTFLGVQLCQESATMSEAFCDTVASTAGATGTFASTTCTTTNSFGACVADGLTTRYYVGDADSQEASCTSSEGTWTADASALVSKSVESYFCEYQDKCQKLDMNYKNAENFCNKVNGYFVDSCN